VYGVRRHAGNAARGEVRALRESGTAVVVFRPGPAEQRTTGNNMRARDRMDQTVSTVLVGRVLRRRAVDPGGADRLPRAPGALT